MYRDIDDYEILYMIKEDNDYYEMMLEKYKPLIITICKKFQTKGKEFGYELEDLIQVANIAIFDAITNYSETENVIFYTYMVQCIKNKLQNEFRNHQTNKKLTLNKAFSYDEIIPGTNKTYLEVIPDDKIISPFDTLILDNMQKEYVAFLNSLPFDVSIAYQLKINGFKNSEIETLLKMDSKTLKRCLNLASRSDKLKYMYK